MTQDYLKQAVDLSRKSFEAGAVLVTKSGKIVLSIAGMNRWNITSHSAWVYPMIWWYS